MNRPIWAIGVTLGIISGAALAYAEDPAAADALFNKGVSEMNAGNYEVACLAIAESQRLDPRPGTLYVFAECEAAAGRIATAVAIYEDFLRTVAGIKSVPARNKYFDRVNKAQAKKDALAKQVPELTLVLPAGASADVRMTRDGDALTAISLGVPIPVDPGEHVITAQTLTGEVRETRVTLTRGQKETVEILLPIPVKEEPFQRFGATKPLPAPSHIEPSADTTAANLPSVSEHAPEEHSRTTLRRTGVIVGGFGVAGAIVGGVLGGLTWQKKSTIEANCVDIYCQPVGKQAADTAQMLGLGSTIAFGIGGMGMAASVVMLVMSRGGKESSKPGVQVGLVEAGPSRAMFGVKGAF